jgi:release factor glutamine methyltransferase
VAVASVASALAAAAERLRAAGCDAPRLDAELLLAQVLGVERAMLVVESRRELEGWVAERFAALVARREAREPVAYILGRRWFRELELHVDPRVLIPRPETELLVEAALELPSGTRVVDVGTGSGAVALALAAERPDLVVRGLDISPDAVAVATLNARRLGLPVSVARADLLDGGRYDAVLANLPYVAEGERASLAPEITRFEPAQALFAGADGLAVIRRLVRTVDRRVRFVALEVGAGQAERVAALLDERGFDEVHARPDLAGIERVVVGRR